MSATTAQRCAAILLLLFAAMDLLVPGLCAVEAPAGESAARIVATTKVADATSDDGVVDDCFCCCAHIVARPRLDFRRSPDEVTPLHHDPRLVPLTGVAALYHPPRP